MLFSLLKHYYITDTALKVSPLCTASLLLYVMVLKTFPRLWGMNISDAIFKISIIILMFGVVVFFQEVWDNLELVLQSH